MKASLIFDLDDSEDRMAHLRCVKSDSMAFILQEVIYNLRKKCENDGGDVFEAIGDLMYDNGINIDELTNQP